MQRRAQSKRPAEKSPAALGLSTLAQLLKPTEWEQLSAADLATHAAAFPALTDSTARAEALVRAGSPASVQDWVAATIGRTFQPYVMDGVASWLDTAPESAHLYVGGTLALGTPQLVAAVARQKVASWPSPSSYCYAPDPQALDQAVLLTLPLGTGAALGKALATLFDGLSQQWGDVASNAQVFNALFAACAQSAPEAAQAYLTALRASMLPIATSGGAYPWAGDNQSPSFGAVAPEPTVTRGAPVVEATLLTTSIVDVLLRANGGVLILSPSTVDVDKLLPVLVAREIVLQDGWPALPLAVRVVLVGTGDVYDTLWSNSDLISQLFRYELWSQGMTAWNRAAEAAYAAFAAGTTHYYGLPAPDVAAVASLVQEGARQVDGLNRSRLTNDLVVIHDIVVEAGKAAQARHAPATTAADVDAILARRRALQGANVAWVQEGILSGESITPTMGVAVGQINGLGILSVHPPEGSFAVPIRISATVVPSKGEHLLDVEREADQSDGSHIRGLLTMEGYFANQYGQQQPLALAARIRFEQEQGGIDGDSASAAELFALLSALSGIPIRCSTAVTGAIGQYGEIQPIGGVNHKIEGFWDLCRIRRQLGEQPEGGYGVLIPAANARDVMLRRAVAHSITSEGWFQVWLMQTVDDALPVLMGVPAAVVHTRVQQRLSTFAALQNGRRRR
ncbi:MAG: AAA family ATPase [Ktedonobacterales bacterium]|nr:AAA family ATPase [Ktedonobacterales bacterium]